MTAADAAAHAPSATAPDDNDVDPCEICASGETECGCYGDDEYCDACGGSGYAVPEHCCNCGGSPYCQCCSTCGQYAGTCGCPVQVALADGTTRLLPPPAAAAPEPGSAALAAETPGRGRPRWRLTFTSWPRAGLALTDTPRPRCPDCDGDGGVEVGGDEDGPDIWPCDCWSPGRRRLLLPLPNWLMPRPYRQPPGGWSDEPPF